MAEAEAEPTAYLNERLRNQLLEHAGAGELDLHVVVEGRLVIVTGHVSTSERRQAIADALTELMPGYEIRNDATVSVFPEAPEEALP